MSGVTQQILLHKLQEAIRRADKTLQSEPPLSSPFTDWKSWKERADDAELVLKQRLTGVNSRTMSDTDSANIARIKHEMAKAKENYEHAQWIANDTAAPSPKVSTSFIAKQEPGNEENMTAGGSLHHPLSTVSAPTPVRFEKKLPNPITLNPPCEACRADSLTCIREYIRRGRVRCDRCVTKGYRCSFPAGRSQALSAAQTPVIADSEASRPQRKRTIPFNEDNAESPFGKRTRAYPPPSQIINVIDDDEPIPASAPPRIQGRRNLKEPSSSTNAINGTSLRGKAPGGSERKALMKMIIRERETILEKTTAIVDEVFDRIIEEMEGSS